MKVIMQARISGTRDGEDWPAPGESIDLPDDEAVQLLATGQAVAAGEDAVETAVKPRRAR